MHMQPTKTPNRQHVEGAVVDAVRQTLGRYPIDASTERELVGRIFGALGPILQLVDLPFADEDDLREILGDYPLRARLDFDPPFAMLAHTVVQMRRELNRLRANEQIVWSTLDARQRQVPAVVDPGW